MIAFGVEMKNTEKLSSKVLLDCLNKTAQFTRLGGSGPFLLIIFTNELQAKYFDPSKEKSKQQKSSGPASQQDAKESSRKKYLKRYATSTALFKLICDDKGAVTFAPLDAANCQIPDLAKVKLVAIVVVREDPTPVAQSGVVSQPKGYQQNRR